MLKAIRYNAHTHQQTQRPHLLRAGKTNVFDHEHQPQGRRRRRRRRRRVEVTWVETL
jgi:hypothetical protein